MKQITEKGTKHLELLKARRYITLIALSRQVVEVHR